MSSTVTDLERGREAYARRAWLEAYEAFARADEETPLEAEDLELLTWALMMLGRDDDAIVIYERAHHRYLERGETLRAVHCSTWIGVNLAYRGAVGPASGWLARSQRLLEGGPQETAEHGFLMIPLVFRHEASGDYEAAAAVAREAAALGQRFGDRDLFAMAIHAEGQMQLRLGRVGQGLGLLDESMVAVTTGGVTPFVVGIVYCGVILACQEVFEVGRAREWTRALTAWVDEQPDLVAFTGRCLVHRAEILQLSGSWTDALEELQRAVRRFVETSNPAAGLAQYRQGELLRLVGKFDAAEEAYREASKFGWEPQPGLAQLRLAQGKSDAALAAIRRANAEISEPLKRAALLPAYVEIALAVDEMGEARTACRELEELAERYESAMLGAITAHARGAVALAEGEPQSALVSLRAAWRVWLELEAPYEVARTRVLVAEACSVLGDEDAAVLELAAAREVFEQLGARPDLERLAGPALATHGLTQRELEVLRLVARGKSNREIASSLVISEHTVARHVQNLYAKLGVSSRAAATAFAFERDLV